jgi:hypothetical protein
MGSVPLMGGGWGPTTAMGLAFGNRQFFWNNIYSENDKILGDFFCHLKGMKALFGGRITSNIEYSLSYNRFSTLFKPYMQFLTQT